MATTKTLTPTNQAITLAAFTEKPDNRTNVTNDDKLADAVNALNSKLNDYTNTKKSYNTAFDITIPSSASSIAHFYCDRVGRTIFIDVVFISSSAINANAQIAHTDGLTNVMPAHVSAIGSGGSGGRFLVGSYGTIVAENAIPANEYFSFTIICQYNNSIG